MSKISRLIKEGDSVKLKQYMLNEISEGKIMRFQVKSNLKKIEFSSLGDDIFLPYVEFDGIKEEKSDWNKKYLSDLRLETVATGKFDKEFVMHMSEVSDHVYRPKRIAVCAGALISIAGIAVAASVILK